ncbi:MAG: phosphatase PAP2 family protein [Tatlockia sp.]|nr:phosphatase PAP2 family protein [Tatlockia sp.]
MSPFERLFKTMTNPIVVVLYFGLIIALILKYDQPISTYLFHLDLRTNFSSLNYLTKIGLGGLYYPSFLGLALFFRYIRKNPIWEARFWFLLLCLIIPAILTLVLKISFGRARPDLFLQSSEHLYGFFGFKWKAIFWSFPSGHTTTIMSVVLGLGIVFPRYFLAFMLLGLSVALSRILLTHHYLSDVLFAIYLTVIAIGCLLYLLKSKSWLTPAWKHTI